MKNKTNSPLAETFGRMMEEMVGDDSGRTVHSGPTEVEVQMQNWNNGYSQALADIRKQIPYLALRMAEATAMTEKGLIEGLKKCGWRYGYFPGNGHDEGMIEEIASKYARKVDATLRTEVVRLKKNKKTVESVAIPNVLPASVEHIIADAMKQYAERMVARARREIREDLKSLRSEHWRDGLDAASNNQDAQRFKLVVKIEAIDEALKLPSLREGDNKDNI